MVIKLNTTRKRRVVLLKFNCQSPVADAVKIQRKAIANIIRIQILISREKLPSSLLATQQEQRLPWISY